MGAQVDPVGHQLRSGGEREPALGETRVRQHKLLGLDHKTRHDEEVEVELARSPPRFQVAVSSGRGLQLLAERKHRTWRDASLDQHCGVEVLPLWGAQRRAAPDARAREQGDLATETGNSSGKSTEYVPIVASEPDQHQHASLLPTLK